MSRLEKIDGVEIIYSDDGKDEIRLGHTLEEVYILMKFLSEDDLFLSFFEIGVHEGGLSYILLPKPLYTFYYGIEIDCGLVRSCVKERYTQYNQKLMCIDCFDPSLLKMMKETNKKVIYCDGGNKPKELGHFSPVCNSGDVILAHDFGTEVQPYDILFLDRDESFVRLSQFYGTRIVGWKKK